MTCRDGVEDGLKVITTMSMSRGFSARQRCVFELRREFGCEGKYEIAFYVSERSARHARRDGL